MLPGFRFLFATIVLAVSVLIFGLGAAALLRAAHEEFASLPALSPIQPQYLPLRSDPPPTLALLRVETPEARPAEIPGPDTRETVGSAERIAPANPPQDAAATPDAARNALAKASDAEAPSQPAAADIKSAEARTVAVVAPEPKASDAKTSDAKTSDVKTSDIKASEIKVPEASLSSVKTPDSIGVSATNLPVLNPPQPDPAAPARSQAGLPDARASEMASADATDEATAVIVQPANPVVTKARGLSARAIARRRMLARARAAARARALQLQQQQRPKSDPFAQLFYGGARS